MKIKCILSAAMAGVLLMTGCSGDNTESVATYDLDAAGKLDCHEGGNTRRPR